MLLHGFLNGSIVFLLNHKFAKNNTPIFHMETLFLFFANKITTAQPYYSDPVFGEVLGVL